MLLALGPGTWPGARRRRVTQPLRYHFEPDAGFDKRSYLKHPPAQLARRDPYRTQRFPVTDPSEHPPQRILGLMRLHELERQYDIHLEGHSVIGGFIYRGSRIGALAGRYVFGELSRLFNFPSGPHNFGKLLSLSEQPA